MPAKSAWPSLSGAPGAFAGFFFGLRWKTKKWDGSGFGLSMPNPFAWAPSRGPCVVLVYNRDLWVQRVQWGAGNGVKVPFSTVRRAPTNLGVTCLQGAPWGLFLVFWLEPPAAPCLVLLQAWPS